MLAILALTTGAVMGGIVWAIIMLVRDILMENGRERASVKT